MSGARLPDFEHTLALAQGNLEAAELSECHGIACGLLCRQPDCSMDDFVSLLEVLELLKLPGTGLRISLDELLTSTRLQLADEDMSLSLWLPDDDEPLEDRTAALSLWCSGFLAALGSGDTDSTGALSDDAHEAMNDLQEISRADVTDTSQSEDDESAFVEIVEFVRVVTLMIREDLRGPDGQDLVH